MPNHLAYMYVEIVAVPFVGSHRSSSAQCSSQSLRPAHCPQELVSQHPKRKNPFLNAYGKVWTPERSELVTSLYQRQK